MKRYTKILILRNFYLLFFLLFFLVISFIAFSVFGIFSNKSGVERLLHSNNLNVGIIDYSSDSKQISTHTSIKILQDLTKEYKWKLTVHTYKSLGEMNQSLKKGDIDLAADMVVDKLSSNDIVYTSSYATTTPWLVYFPSVSKKIKSLKDISNDQLLVIQNSWQSYFTLNLSYLYRDLEWQEISDFWTQEDLIFTIQNQPGGYLLVTDIDLQYYKKPYPKLTKGISFDPVPLAFTINKDNDALRSFINVFLANYKEREEQKQNKNSKRFLDDILKPSQLEAFLLNIKRRFPKYAKLFFDSSLEYLVDWRLIAAIAYQESLWDEHAVSPTGVKGLMMLTRPTARFMGIKDRKDPLQSVDGGTRYFLYLKELLPDRIQEPDRTWLALAGYNIGPAHLEDVRIITENHNKNPDVWQDVREFLPYIEKQEWYAKSKYGYARGREAQKYVDNIKKYYQVLISLGIDSKPSVATYTNKFNVNINTDRISIVVPDVISLRY